MVCLVWDDHKSACWVWIFFDIFFFFLVLLWVRLFEMAGSSSASRHFFDIFVL